MAHYETDRFGEKDYLEYTLLTDFSFPTHFHRCLEFVYLLTGEMTIFYNTEALTLKAGESVLFLPNEIHGFETKQHSKLFSLVFSPELVAPFMKLIKNKKALVPRFLLQEKCLEEILLDFNPFATNTLKVQGFLSLICGNFLEQASWVASDCSQTSLMHQIIDYMGKHFREDINLKSLSYMLGYDASYLSRFISKNMHITFHRYLTLLRLTYSIELLAHSDQTITDIAMQSGFSCIRTYNGVFKKTYGISPRQYLANQDIKTGSPGTH